jgi:hypothetical protein
MTWGDFQFVNRENAKPGKGAIAALGFCLRFAGALRFAGLAGNAPMKTAAKSASRAKLKPAQDAPSRLIDARIRELGDWRGAMLAEVRAVIRKADPLGIETWKWRGVPVWEHDGIILHRRNLQERGEADLC